MSTRGGLVDASNAIKHLRERLKQDLPREVSRGHSTMVVANTMGWTSALPERKPERNHPEDTGREI